MQENYGPIILRETEPCIEIATDDGAGNPGVTSENKKPLDIRMLRPEAVKRLGQGWRIRNWSLRVRRPAIIQGLPPTKYLIPLNREQQPFIQ